MENDKLTRRPLIDPLLMALKSRRVLVALSTLVLAIILTQVPMLAPFGTELLMVLVTLSLALIGGYSLEDSARIARTAAMPQEELRDLLRLLIRSVIDELAGEPDEEQ